LFHEVEYLRKFVETVLSVYLLIKHKRFTARGIKAKINQILILILFSGLFLYSLIKNPIVALIIMKPIKYIIFGNGVVLAKGNKMYEINNNFGYKPEIMNDSEYPYLENISR